MKAPHHAVRHLLTSVAFSAPSALEHLRAASRRVGHRPVRVPIGTSGKCVEARHVGSEGVQRGTESCLRIPERVRARARVKEAVLHQSGPAEVGADVVLEVLHLIEVGGPMHGSMSGARAPLKRDRVAQALPAVREVPDAPVLTPVQVATRARDVPVAAQAGIIGVVEELLAEENVCGEGLLAQCRDGGYARGRSAAARREGRDVDDADAPRERRVHEQALVSIENEAIGREIRREASDRGMRVGVEDFDVVGSHEGDEEKVAAGAVRDARRQAAIIEVDTHIHALLSEFHVEAAHEGSDDVVEVRSQPIEHESATRVGLRSDDGA